MILVGIVVAALSLGLPASAQVKAVVPVRVSPGPLALPTASAELRLPGGPALPAPSMPAPPVAAGRGAMAPAGVARALKSAGAAQASPERSLDALTAIFDGMPPEARGEVLEGLEASVRAEPKDVALRRAFQGLVARDELAVVEPKLRGVALAPERREAVLSKTEFHDVRWWQHFTGRPSHPEAYGVARPDLGIQVHIHRGWRKMPSLAEYVRVVFSHEYTHRLQYEGEATRAFGVEIPAIGTEMLRAVELAGLEALKGGRLVTIAERLLGSFDNGRTWMGSASLEGKAPGGLYFEGFLAGAAFELALKTGRWSDAWSYHRRVTRGEEPLAVRREMLAG